MRQWGQRGERRGTYLAREREEVDCDRAAAASCQWWCLWMAEAMAHMPLRNRLMGESWATYVLSFADFKLSRNCRPLAVVVSTVSVFVFDSACAQSIQGQQSLSIISMLGVASVATCIVGDGRDVAAPWRGWREREGLLVEPSRRGPCRSHAASRPTPLTVSEPPPTIHATLLGVARTGTFWRFAGRPSPSPTAALAALRLAALSISAGFVIA
jgi:hypothetical protein